MTTAVAKTEAEKPSAVLAQELDRLTPAFKDVLPNNMDVARFKRVVLQAVAKNADLMACTPTSIILAVSEAAQLGLEPTGSLSQAWLIPYNENVAAKGQKAQYVKKAQLQIGIRGLEELARRSGQVRHIMSRVVYEGDEFEVRYGHDERIIHVPAFETVDPTKITHVYAIAHMTDGSQPFDVMTKDQVDAIRARSKAANFGPWVTDYAEMSRKTVSRRLVKTLPLTIEAREAIERDDDREFGAGTPPVVSTRNAEIRGLLTAKGVIPAPPPPDEEPPTPKNAPGAKAKRPAPDDAAPDASAKEQAADAGVAENPGGEAVCGATSDPALGEVETCVLPPGHLDEPGAKQRHQAASGSVWPAAKEKS
jgi:recombination protein RecT